MKSFLKYTLATIVGIIVTSILFFFLGFITLSIIISSQNKPVEVAENSVLMLKLNTPIVERDEDDPFSGFNILTFEPDYELGLNVLLESIEKAGEEENIKGIYLTPTILQAGWGTVQEIRDALIEFKKTGKFVYAYSDIYSQKAYYLASVADKLYLNPEGTLEFIGLSTEVLFYKEAFEKLGIDVNVFRRGKYKSYAEPFINDEMSAENREQLTRLLNLMWENVLNDIADSRDLGIDFLNQQADSLTTIRSAKNAKLSGFVDDLKYKDEIINELKSMTGNEKDDNGLPVMTVWQMEKVPKQRKTKGLAKEKIAVIYGQGGIIPGEGDGSTIGADRVSKAIRQARKDDKVKAIVVRINSGGGSTLASEIIWREVKLAAETKPVIASMGDIAASGGYYVLTHADTIIAEPNTITGSIGVVGMFYNARELFNEKLGISSDIVKTNSSADLLNLLRPFSSHENQVIEALLDSTYDTFISRVADGRNLEKNFVDSIGQGRVWNALDAQRLGLVDMLGNVDDAISIAAEKANLEAYRIVELPRLEDPFVRLMKRFSREMKTNAMKKELGIHYKHFQRIKEIENYQGIQARIPFEFVVE